MQNVLAEYDDLVLPDLRLTKRVREIVRHAQVNPSLTLPEMLKDSAQLEGAYRLVNNSRVTHEALLAPHVRKTCARAAQEPDVVSVLDITEVETPFADAEDVGSLRTGRSGYEAMIALAISFRPGRPSQPLGVVHNEIHCRSEEPKKRKGTRKHKKENTISSKTACSEDKAYLRWSRAMESVCGSLKGCGRITYVADREADSYALFCKALALGAGCVFRARSDRCAIPLCEEDLLADKSLLSEIAVGLRGVFQREVPLSKRGQKSAPNANKRHPPREARGATLHYSATQVELLRPNIQPATLPESLFLWLVRVWEPNPPAGETPVAWMLLTTEPCTTAAEIARVVDIYRSRWLIEDFFKSLKSVCNLEERRFTSRDALLNILALLIPLAVHLLWLRTVCRDTPDAPAAEVFTPLQLEILKITSHRKMPVDPTAAQAVWVLAGLGGHIANNGWPGTIVLARSLVRLVEAVKTWRELRLHADVLSRHESS